MSSRIDVLKNNQAGLEARLDRVARQCAAAPRDDGGPLDREFGYLQDLVISQSMIADEESRRNRGKA